MGLLDKVKNLFTDEEFIEEEDDDVVSIKEVKREDDEEKDKLPTFMREKIEEEELNKSNIGPDFKMSFDTEKPKKIEEDGNFSKEEDSITNIRDNSFKFPIEFDDNDFIETRSRRSSRSKETTVNSNEVKKVNKIEENNNKVIEKQPKEVRVADLYKDKKEEKKEEKKKFKISPVISPIYGVLDKNYQPDDVAQNLNDNFEVQRPSKSLDFDSVRKKAYGRLEDDIKENLMCENCEYLKEAKECRSKKKQCRYNDDSLITDIVDEMSEEKDISLEQAAENYFDYGKEYTINSNNSINEDVVEEKEDVNSIPPVKSKINLLSTLKKSSGDDIINNNMSEDSDNDLELTDDLFSLIDSMYDEENDK